MNQIRLHHRINKIMFLKFETVSIDVKKTRNSCLSTKTLF